MEIEQFYNRMSICKRNEYIIDTKYDKQIGLKRKILEVDKGYSIDSREL